MRNFQVAIDGPAGSGKSTISKIVASKLGFTHIDTGAMYRALTYEALRRKINLENESEYTFLDEVIITYLDDIIYLNGVNISKEIRESIVTNHVSVVSRHRCVREKLVALQQKIAQNGKILMDGRDIGYCVLPHADLKIFLTANIDERAKRRYGEMNDPNADIHIIKQEIIKRDYLDTTREISPLRKAHDAIIIDTSYSTIEEVVLKIEQLILERIK